LFEFYKYSPEKLHTYFNDEDLTKNVFKYQTEKLQQPISTHLQRAGQPNHPLREGLSNQIYI